VLLTAHLERPLGAGKYQLGRTRIPKPTAEDDAAAQCEYIDILEFVEKNDFQGTFKTISRPHLVPPTSLQPPPLLASGAQREFIDYKTSMTTY